MFLKKSVMLSLLFTLVLSGCSGSDGFGVGNGSGGGGDDDDGDTTPTPTPTVSLALGTGVGDTFIEGGLTTSIGSSLLSFGGDSTVSVNIVDVSDNSLYTAESTTVSFTSNCVQAGQSLIDASVNTSSGVAVATYAALTCEGADTVTATLSDGSSATAIITVANQVLGALEFVQADPATLSLKGSGTNTIPEVSTISFSLKDKTGAPMSGETITYELSTEVGGITLSSDSSVTDSGGMTSIQLNSGGVNTSVVVTASVEVTNSDGSTSTTSTTSNPIAIVGGIPDQDSFSIAATILNPRGWNYQGTTSAITVRAADRYNNPARTGTQISFITNGGSIVGSCALANGACSVNWTSQEPKPVGGRARILARSTGEESFTDANYNGIYDLGENVIESLSEAFLDIDESGTRNLDTEFFSDFNDNGVYDDVAGTKFKGTNCSEAALADGHCATLVDVRQQIDLCMSTDETFLASDVGPTVDVSGGPVTITLSFFDANNNTPANGTTISTSVEDGEILGGGQIAVPNECDYGFTHRIVVGADDDAATASGELKVNVTQVDLLTKTYTFTLLH